MRALKGNGMKNPKDLVAELEKTFSAVEDLGLGNVEATSEEAVQKVKILVSVMQHVNRM
tara:strand:- start:303 stop:479 length:177 start_codon:yes stop_codon:yes gene_type:complete